MWFSPDRHDIWKIYTKLKIVSQTYLDKTENCVPDNFFSDTHESEVKRCPSVNGESQCDVHVSPGVVASRAVERREVSIEEFKWESIVCLDVPSHVQVHVYMCKTAEKDKEKKVFGESIGKGTYLYSSVGPRALQASFPSIASRVTRTYFTIIHISIVSTSLLTLSQVDCASV